MIGKVRNMNQTETRRDLFIPENVSIQVYALE